MSLQAKRPAFFVLALTAICHLGGAFGEEPSGPMLVLPSPAYANLPVPEGVSAVPAPVAAEPGVAEGVGPAPGAAGATEDDAPDTAPAAATDSDDDPPHVAEPPKPRRELSPGMAALRDRVRRTLAAHRAQPLSTAGNTVTEVIYACRAFGCDAEVFEAGTLGAKLNGITCLTWNYPCAGFVPLTISDGHITGRIGFGYQEYPGQLIATLALARVPASYPVRVGDDERTVADLVEYEKLACREDADHSLSMIGLMYYTGPDATWHNRLGEEWSIERMVEEELAKPVIGAPWGGTQRLMGLSCVVRRRAKRDESMDGQYRRAKDYVLQFHDHALSLQNDDGSWSPHYLAAKGTSRDPGALLASTGRILEWLAFSLPEERLDEPGVVRAVHFVNHLVSSSRYAPQNVKSLRTEEIGAVMHSLAALRHYDARYFKPADPPAGP